MNNVQLSQEGNVKKIRLHLDGRLTWHKHIFTKRKQLGITLTKMYWLLGRKSQLSTRNKLLIYKTILKPIWPWNTTLGYGFHFQQRNPRTLRIQSFVHDSGCTLESAEYSNPKGSPITNPLLQPSIQCFPQCTPKWPDNNRWLQRHLPNDLPTRFLV
jgi:hypothetical protein